MPWDLFRELKLVSMLTISEMVMEFTLALGMVRITGIDLTGCL